ncbi:MAG: hypothetical protein FWD13_01570 [Treponema sp.]|nr:hypothetical protein [Treponema sp.]
MKKNIIVLFLTLVILVITACNDPIFYTISKETPLQKPRIDGSPTKFVEFDGAMFVASGKSLYYYKDDIWNRISLENWIRDIAATSGHLYICTEESGEMIWRASDLNFQWNRISTGTLNVQKIFGVTNALYISSITGSGSTFTYAIHNLPDSGTSLQEVSTGTNGVSMLNGVAASGSDVFLCSTFDNTDRNNVKGGIFHTTIGSSAAALVPGSFIPVITQDTPTLLRFTGIISLDTTPNIIAAIDYNGRLYKVTPSGLDGPVAEIKDGRRTTGALGIWQDKNNPTSDRLLLVGRQDIGYSLTTGFTYGYIELKFSVDGTINAEFKNPGSDPLPTTISNYEQFLSSLGKNPINYIHQFSGNGMLFASTQYRGVWSYKVREGSLQWNAED